jgi:hypothetical protein
MHYRFFGIFAICLLVLSSTLAQEAKHEARVKSREDMILKALKPELLDQANADLVTEEDDSFVTLLATTIVIRAGNPLSEKTLKGLLKLANSSDNGFKELYASELLLEADFDLSDRALDRAIGIANRTIKPWPAKEEKQKLAVLVLQTYRRKILKQQAQ